MNVRRDILDHIFRILILILSLIFFHKIIFATEYVLIHGDYRYALTVEQHIQYHLNKIFIHAPKLPFLFVLYLMKIAFGDILAEKFFTVYILFLSTSLIYSSNKYFLNKIFDKHDGKILISALIGAIGFIYNPWTINKIHHHYWLVLSIASSYCLLAKIDNFVHNSSHIDKKIFQILLISSLIVSIAVQVQALILYTIPMLGLYVSCFLLFEKSRFLVKLSNKKLIFVFFITLLLNLFWILPQLIVLTSGVTKPGGYGIVVENVDTLSRRSSFLNVLTATNMFIWGGRGSVNYKLVINGIDVWRIFSFLPVILSSISILIIPRICTSRDAKCYFTYFVILFILSIVLSTGSYYPVIGDAYRWVFLKTSLGWAIRDPYKNTGLIVISINILITTLVFVIIEKIKGLNAFKIALVLSIIWIVVTWGWPALTGDLNGHLRQSLVKYPEDLEKTIEYLKDDSNCVNNILWYPPKIDSVYFVYHDVPEISSSNLNLIDLENEGLTKYMENILKNSCKMEVLCLLSRLGVKYVILRQDLLESSQSSRLLKDIKAFELLFEDSRKIKFGDFTVYEIKNTCQIIDVYPLITYGTIPDLKKDFIFKNVVYNIYFEDFYIVGERLLPSFINNNYIVKVRSEHHNPSTYWSIGSFEGGWLKTFLGYLEKFDLEDWQFIPDSSLVFTWSHNANLTISYKIVESGYYEIFICYFKNRQGGSIKVYIENDLVEINTKEQINKFSWRKLGIFYLKSGEHKIILQNVDGFNAVGLFALIPEEEHFKIKMMMEKILQNQTIIYIFDANSDLYKSRMDSDEYSNFYDSNSVKLNENDKLWQYVEIVKNGTYRLALRGIGKFMINIGDKQFIVDCRSKDFVYSSLFNLSLGKYKLEIVLLSDSGILERIYLFSTDTFQTIDQLFQFEQPSVRIESYEELNPFLWKVKVSTARPFMLSFAKTYDQFWEVNIYKKGEKIKAVRSIPLYGLINGFWIDETGELEILIKYKPWDYFKIGLIVSAVTFICYITYLFYIWVRFKAGRVNDKLSIFTG
ncbi:hypothetical protein DRO58_00500 [Candidatus Bathyarchaeota archaeon]|nr:MAG: hypothetical protein DRO58_00500 [Candidatus Bathyarchaeota archaeon]